MKNQAQKWDKRCSREKSMKNRFLAPLLGPRIDFWLILGTPRAAKNSPKGDHPWLWEGTIIDGSGLGSYLVVTLGGSVHFFRFCFHFWWILAPFWTTLAQISLILAMCFVVCVCVSLVFGTYSILLGCWVVVLLGSWVLGFLSCWVALFLGCWVVGWFGCLLVVGLLGYWVVGLLGWWVVGLLGCWVGGMVDCWIGLLDRCCVGLLNPESTFKKPPLTTKCRKLSDHSKRTSGARGALGATPRTRHGTFTTIKQKPALRDRKVSPPSQPGVVGLLCCWVLGFLDSWVVGLPCFWVVGLLSGLVVCLLLDCWVVGLVGCWIVELDCSVVVLLVCCTVDL